MNQNIEGNNALQNEQDDNKIAFLQGKRQIKIRDFGINKLKQEMSVKEYIRQHEKFLYNDPVQRNEVWDTLKRSLLIHSVIMGIPVPNIYVQMLNGKYNVIDGKQRLTTLKAFVDNKFALHKETPNINVLIEGNEEQGLSVANFLFNALPEEFQDRILAHTVVLEVLEMDDEIKNLVFQRLNNNESLKPMEKLVAYMNEETNEYLYNMSKNKFIEVANLSSNLRNRQGDREVILQSLLVIDKNGETGIGSEDYRKWVIDTGVPTQVKADFANAMLYLNQVVEFIDKKHYKEAFKKTHIPMLTYIASRHSQDIAPQEFAKWVCSFLVERYKNEQYREFASSKAASKENVSARFRLMLKDFKKTFNLS